MKLVLIALIVIVSSFNATEIEFQNPIDNPEILSGFGERTHPVLQTARFHDGVDYKADSNSKVRASAKGIIKSITATDSNSYHLVIDHGSGFKSQYSSLKSVSQSIEIGTTVNQGDFLGSPGKLSHSTMPVLHFGISKNGTSVDPLQYLK
jgi:murein DD-endopeptidase MepM/ murein hydrolase activator NlpD